MTESFYRKCKYCGRTIELRHMPDGRWVAYEDHDKVHYCLARRNQLRMGGSKRQAARYAEGELPTSIEATYDDLDFLDISPGRLADRKATRSPYRAAPQASAKPRAAALGDVQANKPPAPAYAQKNPEMRSRVAFALLVLAAIVIAVIWIRLIT